MFLFRFVADQKGVFGNTRRSKQKGFMLIKLSAIWSVFTHMYPTGEIISSFLGVQSEDDSRHVLVADVTTHTDVTRHRRNNKNESEGLMNYTNVKGHTNKKLDISFWRDCPFNKTKKCNHSS